MPSQKNITELNNLKEKLSKAKSLVLADYCGLTVNQINTLRNKIREVGGELKITKNTLLRIALKQSNLQLTTNNSQLTGPTAVVFAYDDEIAPLKAIADFAKEQELPKFKAGFLDDRLLTIEELEQLANLPTKDQLQAKLVGCLNSPISGFVYTLKANLNKLVMVLKQIKNN